MVGTSNPTFTAILKKLIRFAIFIVVFFTASKVCDHLNLPLFQFECCGVDNVDDYDDAKKWDKDRRVKDEETDVVANVTLETPFSCCKVTGSFPNVEPVDKKCAAEPTANNSNKDTVSKSVE